MSFRKTLNRHSPVLIFILCFTIEILVLFSGGQKNLFPMPTVGMDQYRVLVTASGMYHGKLPPEHYSLSPGYTLFVYFLIICTRGNILAMRIIQAAICSLTPVLIYKTVRRLRFRIEDAQTASLLYCFYGPIILVSLSFLRAGLLALIFLCAYFFFIKGITCKKAHLFLVSGIFAGLSVLFRENFIPIIFLPLLLLIPHNTRTYINTRKMTFYFTGIVIIIAPIILYNFIRFSSISIIPGNFTTVTSCYYGNLPLSERLAAIINRLPTNCFNYISNYEIPNSLSFYAHSDIIQFMKIFILPFNLLFGLAIVAMISFRKKPGVQYIVYGIFLYLLTIVSFPALYRFRLPLIPLVCTLAAVGLLKILKNIRLRTSWYWLVFLIGFCLITYKSPDKSRLVNERLAVANILIRNGDYTLAENYLNKLNSMSINTNRQWNNLINKLIEIGDFKNAARIRKNKREKIQE